MANKRIKGGDCRIFVDGVDIAEGPRCSPYPPPEGYSGTLTLTTTLDSAEALRALHAACENAPKAKAAMTCLSCGTAEDFHGHPSVKEAMVQINNFSHTHAECTKGQNDEREATRGTL